MKTLMALFCMGILLASASNALAGKWYGGVKGGLNLGDVSEGDADMRTGFQGGAFFGANFTPQFGGRVEGLYVMKGAKGTVDPGDDHAHDAELKLSYVEFPVLLVANFSGSESVGFNLFAGPTFGFNVSSEIEIEEHGTEDQGDVTNSFEFGAAIGAGVEFKMETMSVTGDIRYSLGASSIFDGEGDDSKNRGIGIMLGLQFPLGAQ